MTYFNTFETSVSHKTTDKAAINYASIESIAALSVFIVRNYFNTE